MNMIIVYFFILFPLSYAFSNFLSYNKRNSAVTFYKEQRIGSSRDTHLFASSPPIENVGVIGKGYVCTLTAKLAALSGYKTWMLHADDEEETIKKLINDKDTSIMKDLELIKASDIELLETKLGKLEGLIIVTNNPDEPMEESVIQYIVDKCPSIRRIVLMSRNLNMKGMGFFVKASKIAANKEVWCPRDELVQKYKSLENLIQEVVANNESISYTFIRAGTLKGGGCGREPSYPKYLTNEFYTMTKNDIVSWQRLFDCETRNVRLFKGDSMPGPGKKAVFTATSYEECDGDTGRTAIAECMVRVLNRSEMHNVDFGVGSRKGDDIPTDSEWDDLFKQVIS